MKKRRVMVLVLLLVIGFAAVSASLIINGSLSIAANLSDFDVYFSNAIEDGVENKKLIKDDTHIVFEHDMSLKGEKYILDYDVTNGSRNYDAKVSINCLGSNEYLNVVNEFDEESILLATETRTGKLTVEVLEAYAGTDAEPTKNIEITCEIVASAVERDTLGEGTPADKKKNEWLLTVDNDGDGEISVGDLISFDTENFYVYDIDGEDIKVISQYNLFVGNYITDIDYSLEPLENPTGMQDSRARGEVFDSYGVKDISYPWYGLVPYVSTEEASNEYEHSLAIGYVADYSAKLNALGANIQLARLITLEELENAGCDSSRNSCKLNYSFSETGERDLEFEGTSLDFLYSTSYWTSSVKEGTSRVYGVRLFGYLGNFTGDIDYKFGIRPVIELKKSQIKVQIDKDIKLCSLANPTVNDMGKKKWIDNDCSNDLSPGDLITFDTESFYIYDIEGDNMKAISQYNLYIGDIYDGTNMTAIEDATGLQDSRALGTVVDGRNVIYPAVGLTFFSSTDVHGESYSSYTGSLAEGYVNDYADKLTSIDSNIKGARLITLGELEEYRCDSSQKTCLAAPEYLWSTQYWTASGALNGVQVGTGSSSDINKVWIVGADGGLVSSVAYGTNVAGIRQGGAGIRPVIEISKKLFE